MERKTLSVQTPFGELTAEIGGDPHEYPEIFVYLKRKDGVEIDLVCASMDKENNEMNAFLYGDTSTDCWTKKYVWTEEELNVEVE
jgi:hypothetical protein